MTVRGATPAPAVSDYTLMSTTTSNATDKIEAHRDELEELAESDVPCADAAEKLLEVADA